MNAVEPRLEANRERNRDDIECVFGASDDHPDSASVRSFVESRLGFAREPVCRADLSGGVLYHECLARLRWGAGESLAPGAFLPRLEALGLMRWFDRLVVGRTIDALRADPNAVYGCNIAAASAVLDSAWLAIFRRLEREPSVAARLVVEITETEPLNPVAGRAFVHRFRQAGCRVAIDDFGVGYSALNNLVVGNPDIVKLDRSVLSLIKRNAIGRYQFRRLIAFAHENARHVVVEGVENELDREILVDSGVAWAQGIRFSWRSPAAA
ncbi:EAL domain-containing protein [Burkholderia vietnamiensis]|jgi:EAL domain-containing protein (putative c-di-GMP-specific phosphodiesterase class I)|uniref:Diguanylate phosphodiesterase n=2 Tax=Burkholderia vietnamiensis TaxID=60552 RepID=A4JJM5_BURVG|nr:MULTISPECIES: EAL domain-containing protein [Burkholderia]ABO56478.1 diguanylate phosphodiesterase [Burkholderia vietnamiensis G4]AJY03702.1 EAL domain protein [Burkholderia vietnamiensis LMG 10929]AOJ99181.1 diguanylate phosphodiesterase [Burkholderia vietnamiensis]AOK11932.1 diguanylate phosphodiesterase [Burkholderia vietnamiensis]AOK44036.1 diguanylate phosphodiesterase [Burkholderia vietnamiensis]